MPDRPKASSDVGVLHASDDEAARLCPEHLHRGGALAARRTARLSAHHLHGGGALQRFRAFLPVTCTVEVR
jgi:hypothetical protein